VTLSIPALGTTAVLAAVVDARLPAARGALERELELVDAACSRFRPDSELVRVNEQSGRAVRIGAYLHEALRIALRTAELTGGLVDPTVGRSLRLAGYDTTFRLVVARDADAFVPRYEAAAGWRKVELDDHERTVRVPAGVELDLGATAKAHAADRAARAGSAAAGCGVLVALGGDVSVAGDPPEGGWTVGIADDHGVAAVETVAIGAGGLATSSVTVRRWNAGGARLHHIIDPRTGRSAQTPWRTASVAAASCLDANVAATAALLLGDAAPAWLATAALPARLVTRGGRVLRVSGWPCTA